MSKEVDQPLPFPPDAQQLVTLSQMVDVGGWACAVEGSPRFDLYEQLLERGWVKRRWAEGVGAFMYDVTKAGREALGDSNDSHS
ncbi:MAG: hypothetical protein AAGI24_04235 [Pseudomonadota bacterium]